MHMEWMLNETWRERNNLMNVGFPSAHVPEQPFLGCKQATFYNGHAIEQNRYQATEII